MQRVTLLLSCLSMALLGSPNFATAQDSTGPPQGNQVTPADVLGGFFGDSMQAQITEITTKMIDGYLDYLAKPQTTKRLATFQKGYYGPSHKKCRIGIARNCD